MKLKPITIRIDEDNHLGHIHIRVEVEHREAPRGKSEVSWTIKEHTIGRKLETITRDILATLKDLKNEGSLEEPYSAQKDESTA